MLIAPVELAIDKSEAANIWTVLVGDEIFICVAPGKEKMFSVCEKIW